MIFPMTLHRPMRSLARSFATLTLLVAFVGPNVANAAPAAPPAPPAPLEPPSPPAPLAPPEAPTVGPPAPLVPPAQPTAAPVKAVPHQVPVKVPMPATAAAPPANPPAAAPPPPQTTESAPPLGAQVDDKDPRALDQFQTQLDPYGAWADDPKFGHVWVPARSVVGENFSPYVTAGHWALDTEDNYVWVSDYPFGDVVFHYGRWAWTSYGWSWIPGYQYAPSWVSWRVPTAEYAYVGWAPLAPSFVWMGGIAVSLWYPSPYYWVFCPSAYLFAPYPYHHIVTYPPYVQSVGAYTRNYVPARPTAGPPKGPPMALAKVPPQAVPAHRMVAGASNAHIMSNTMPRTTTSHAMSSPRVVSSAPAVRPAPNAAAPPIAGGPRTYPSSRPPVVGPPRAVSSTAFSSPTYRGYNQGFSSARTYSPSPGGYSPSAGVYSPSSSPRTYSPSYGPRVYSPSSSPVYSPSSSPRVYSPPSSVYSPSSSPRVYSPSTVSPRVYSPASSSPRMYSPSHTYSPSFGGAHTYGSGGGGHHR
jgi:hypothetical protein